MYSLVGHGPRVARKSAKAIATCSPKAAKAKKPAAKASKPAAKAAKASNGQCSLRPKTKPQPVCSIRPAKQKETTCSTRGVARKRTAPRKSKKPPARKSKPRSRARRSAASQPSLLPPLHRWPYETEWIGAMDVGVVATPMSRLPLAPVGVSDEEDDSSESESSEDDDAVDVGLAAHLPSDEDDSPSLSDIDAALSSIVDSGTPEGPVEPGVDELPDTEEEYGSTCGITECKPAFANRHQGVLDMCTAMLT